MKIFLKNNAVEITTLNKHKNKLTSSQKFQFTKLFDEKASQDHIFNHICQPMLKDVFQNFKSGAIFSYGVTNAGKTYTIIGNRQNPGLLAKFIDVIYDIKNRLLSKSLGSQF